MTRRDVRSQDELPMVISLATAIAILVSAVAVMWVWSLSPENLPVGTNGRGEDIPLDIP